MSGQPYSTYTRHYNILKRSWEIKTHFNAAHLPNLHQLDLKIASEFQYKSFKFESGITLNNLYDNQNISNRYTIISYPENRLIEPTIDTIDQTLLPFTPSIYIEILF